MKKGFTLIELLIVIAIIAALAAITVALISSARKKSDAAFVRHSMDEIRKQTELFVQVQGSYGPNGAGWIREDLLASFNCTPDCFVEDATIRQIMQSTYSHLDIYHPSDPNKYFFYSISGNSWALAVWGYPVGPNVYCVDSRGITVNRQNPGSSAAAITNGQCVPA